MYQVVYSLYTKASNTVCYKLTKVCPRKVFKVPTSTSFSSRGSWNFWLHQFLVISFFLSGLSSEKTIPVDLTEL